MSHNTNHDAIDALKAWGHSEREAAFLYLVAVHSGYFLRRQFCEFTGRGRGSIATHFLRKAATHGLVRAMDVDGRHFVYHLCGKGLYRMLGGPDSQNRRVKSGGEILRRLMLLDYVLRHIATEEFLETEAAKHRYFSLAGADQDAIAAASAFGGSVPVTVRRNGQEQIAHFAFIDEGQRSLSKFGRFLGAYAPLLRKLPHAEVRYVARRPQHFEEAERIFARQFLAQNTVHPTCPLGVDHLLQWLTVERKFHVERHSITPAEHHLLQEGGRIYCRPVHSGVLASWNNGTLSAEKIRGLFQGDARRIGFETELIEASCPRLLSCAVGHATGHEDGQSAPQIALFPNEIEETPGHGQAG